MMMKKGIIRNKQDYSLPSLTGRGWGRVLRGRVSFLLRFYLLTVLLFVVAKWVFMLCNGAGHGVTAGDYLAVAWHGLSLDLSTALYFLIVPFLVTAVSVWVRVPRWVLRVYYAIVAIAFALAFVADTSLYPFWQFKLDASCLQYLSTPTEAMASVSAGYLIVRALLVVAVAGGVYWAYKANGAHGAHGAHGPNGPNGTRRAQWAETIVYLLAVPLMVIGIRGGLGKSTTNIGQVYYSQNQFLNHSAVNPVFSFLASFERSANYVPDYQFMTDDECRQTLDGLFPTESIAVDSLLNTSRPNVVIILLESCGAMFTELCGSHDVMPHLNQLMHEGVSFDHCYGNSWRTDRGTVCTLSGYPSFPVSSVMKMPAKTRHLPNVGKSLAELGYATSYIYGGDINFTNMRSYLIGGGFSRLTWLKDYSMEEQNTSDWGVRDDITFNTLYDQIQQYAEAGTPYLIGYSTLSSHEPWEVPMKRFDDKILNAFYYLDDCIGRLVERLRKTPAWDDLLIVMLPDHSIGYDDLTEHDRQRNLIPMVWTGGAVKAPRRITTICNQTDMAATLLGQMGVDHSQFRFSRDVMSSNYVRPFAVHTYNNGLSVADSTGFAVFDLDVNKLVVNESQESERLVRVGQAVLQAAAQDLKTMR